MSRLEIGIASFPVLLVLIFLRVPIGLAMALVAFTGSYMVNGSSHVILAQLKHFTYGTFSNYSFTIIPLFLLMGELATFSGLSLRLFKAAQAWLGHRRGGLAMSAIAACAGFGSICGSSLATAATMGKIALPELERNGYSGALSTGTLAAGGTLGILIPPSVILVLYAILAEQNIASLFTAAMIPGLFALLSYILALQAYIRLTGDAPAATPPAPYTERLSALCHLWPVLMIFLLVVGGINLGWFTPTEAAAVGAGATGLFGLLSGNLNWSAFTNAIKGTASTTGMVFMIILGAGLYNAFLASTLLPQELANYIASSDTSPWLILTLVLLLYLLLGCVMDSLSMVLLTIPILFPAMSGLDFGLPASDFGLWFGILTLVVVEVGLITPPVGMNLFVINALAKNVPVRESFKGVLPFVMADISRIALLALFPGLTLALVHLFG